MGAKIQIKFLSDKTNNIILSKIIDVFYRLNITYNDTIIGQYTYWTDAPIWELGNSFSVKESKEKKYYSANDMREIIDILSKYYSPVDCFGLSTPSNPILVQLSIVENDDNWKEITVSFDRYQAYDCLDQNGEIEFIDFLKELFCQSVESLSPSYGSLSTEIGNFPESPSDILLEPNLFGDFTFVCESMTNLIDMQVVKNEFKVIPLQKIGIVLIRKHNLLYYGY